MTSTPKMMPLNKEIHGALKINNDKAYAHVADEHLLPLTVHEFVFAGAEYPIIFIKNEKENLYQSVLMLGLTQKQNLFVKDGNWQGSYIPVSARNYPLALVKESLESDRLLIAIDEASSRVGTETGEPLFNEDGTESEHLAKRKEHMAEYLELGQVTVKFIEKLQSLDLLKQQVLTLQIQGEELRINGIYIVDEQKLNEIDETVLVDLHKNGYLKMIYAHLLSLQQTPRLVRRAEQEAS